MLTLLIFVSMYCTNVVADDYTYDRYNRLQNSINDHMNNYETYNRQSKMLEDDSSLKNYYENRKERELRDLKEDMESMDRLRKYGY